MKVAASMHAARLAMQQCPRNAALLCIAALAVLLGNVVFARRDRIEIEYPVKTFAVTQMDTEIGLEYNYFGETIKRNGSGRVRYSNHYFQQYISERVRGYAYHPRFIDYDVKLRAGLSQQYLHYENDSLDEDSHSNDELLGYDVRLEILKENPISGTITSRRDERILMGLYLDRFLVKTESHRGTVRWNRENLQMDATGSHTKTEEYGFRSFSETESDNLEYNLHHQLGSRIRTDLQYRWQEYDRMFRARNMAGDIERDSTTRTQDFNLANRIDFDTLKRTYLRSTFRYHERDGETDLRTYYWQEYLHHRINENLRTYLRGSLRRNEVSDSKVNTYRGEAGLDGDLYRSLSYHFDIHGIRTDYDRLVENRYGATGRLNYRKLTGLGVLSAGYARTIDRVERIGVDGTQEIIDEALTITFSDFEFLETADVIPGSIVVTDRSGNTTYVEGFDYEVEFRGRRAGIRILPGGLISSGETVLVDYRAEIEEDHSYLADDEVIHVRHDFDRGVPGLSIYARRHTLRAHNVDTGRDARILEYTDQMAGLRQEWRDFAFTTEYEMYDDDIGGYNQWRNQLEGNHGINSYLRAGWNTGYTHTEYDSDFGNDVDDESEHLFANAHVNGSFARTGYWRLEARAMHDSGRTERTNMGILARIGYKWRRLAMEGGARYEMLEYVESEQDRMQVYVALKYHLSRRFNLGKRK